MAKEVLVNLRVEGITKTVKDAEELNKIIKDLQDTLETEKKGTTGFDRISKDLEKAKEASKEFDNSIKDIDVEGKGKRFAAFGQKMANSFNNGLNAIRNVVGESELLDSIQKRGAQALEVLTGAQAIRDNQRLKALKETKAGTLAMAGAQKLYNFVMKGSSIALKGFKAALVATGIGALVVLIGSLVANWNNVKKAIFGAGGALQRFGTWLKESIPFIGSVSKGIDSLKNKFGSLKGFFESVGLGIVDFFKRSGQAIVNLATDGTIGDAYVGMVEDFEKRAAEIAQKERLKGLTEWDIKRRTQLIESDERALKIQQAGGEKSIELEREILRNKLELLKSKGEDYKDAETDLLAFDAKVNKQKLDEEEKNNKKSRDAYLKKVEEEKRIQAEKLAEDLRVTEEFNELKNAQGKTETELQLEELEKQKENFIKHGADKLEVDNWYWSEVGKLNDEFAESEKVRKEKEIEDELARADNLYNLTRELAVLRGEEAFVTAEEELLRDKKLKLRNKDLSEAEILAIEDIYKEKSLRLSEEKSKAEKDIKSQVVENDLSLTKDALNAVASLFDGNFKVQKATGAAIATIDTYLGAQKAFNSQFVAGDPTSFLRAGLAAGSAVVSGFARVKKILSTKQGSSGGGGGSSSSGGGYSGGGGGLVQPTTQEQPQIDFSFLGDGDTQSTVQAYVVESDISTEQAKQQKLEELTVL